MTVRGFKLYKVDVTFGLRQQKLVFGADSLEEPAKVLHAEIERICGTTFVGNPVYREGLGDEEVVQSERIKPKTPVMRIASVSRQGDRIDLLVMYGRTGEHEVALRTDGGADVRLEKLAGCYGYRISIYVPTAGKNAVMSSEVIGRSHAGEMFLKRLSKENQSHADRLESDTSNWFRWRAYKMFDSTRIKELVESSATKGLTLKRKGNNADGESGSSNITLTQNGIPANLKGKLAQMLERWALRSLGEYKGVSVSEVDEIVELVDGGVGDLGFSDGEIHFDENGKGQSISPNRLDQIFTYPLRETQVLGASYREYIESRIRPLLIAEKIPIQL